jgi:hypothetical protein
MHLSKKEKSLKAIKNFFEFRRGKAFQRHGSILVLFIFNRFSFRYFLGGEAQSLNYVSYVIGQLEPDQTNAKSNFLR